MTFTIRNPYAVSGTFYKAQLHCHTTESDGRFRPRDLLAMYRDARYAFVCITDHNHVTHYNDPASRRCSLVVRCHRASAAVRAISCC